MKIIIHSPSQYKEGQTIKDRQLNSSGDNDADSYDSSYIWFDWLCRWRRFL